MRPIFLLTPSKYYKCKFSLQNHYQHFTDYIPSSDFKTEARLSTSTRCGHIVRDFESEAKTR